MIGYYAAWQSIVLLATTFGIFHLWQARSNAASASSPLARHGAINGLRVFLAIRRDGQQLTGPHGMLRCRAVQAQQMGLLLARSAGSDRW